MTAILHITKSFVKNAKEPIMKKSIVIYFSRKGETYVNGTIENRVKGNSEIAAEYIADELSAPLFEIKAKWQYSPKYYTLIEEAKEELRAPALPDIESFPDLAPYDTVYLVYPCWWGKIPMPVATLLAHYDWNGKTIRPVCTHEGSGMGSTEFDCKKYAKGAAVTKGLPIHGAEVTNLENQIRRWARDGK